MRTIPNDGVQDGQQFPHTATYARCLMKATWSLMDIPAFYGLSLTMILAWIILLYRPTAIHHDRLPCDEGCRG